MDKADETPVQKKRKRRKRAKNKKITTVSFVPKPIIPPIKRALLDLQTIESMNKICEEIKNSMLCDNLLEPVTVLQPQLDSLVTYATQSFIIRPQSIESPENIAFGEPDAQVTMEKTFNKLKL